MKVNMIKMIYLQDQIILTNNVIQIWVYDDDDDDDDDENDS